MSVMNFGVIASIAFLNLVAILPSPLNAATMSVMNFGVIASIAALNLAPIVPSILNAAIISSMNFGVNKSKAALNFLPTKPSILNAAIISSMNFGRGISFISFNITFPRSIIRFPTNFIQPAVNPAASPKAPRAVNPKAFRIAPRKLVLSGLSILNGWIDFIASEIAERVDKTCSSYCFFSDATSAFLAC